MTRAAVQFGFIILMVGFFLWRESDREPLRAVDTAFIDWLAANARREPATAPVTWVEIDDDSIDPEHPWPWSPLEYAVFLKSLEPVPPRLVGVIPVLAWDEGAGNGVAEGTGAYMGALHSALLRIPKALLAARLGRLEDPDLVPPMAAVPTLSNVSGPSGEIPEFSVLASEPHESLRLAPEIGFVNLPGAPRRVARSVPMLFRYRGELVPAFTLQAAMLWYNVAPDEVEVKIGESIRLGSAAILPIDRTGELLVDFGVPITRVSYSDVVLAARERSGGTSPRVADQVLSGKAVLLGRADREAQRVLFPTGQSGPEAELFARALATVQAGSAPRRISSLFDWAFIAVAALLFPLSLKLRSGSLLKLLVLVEAVYMLAAITLFTQRNLSLPLVLPTVLFVAGYLWHRASPEEPGARKDPVP